MSHILTKSSFPISPLKLVVLVGVLVDNNHLLKVKLKTGTGKLNM